MTVHIATNDSKIAWVSFDRTEKRNAMNPKRVAPAARIGFRCSRFISWEVAEHFRYAMHDQEMFFHAQAREEGMTQFLDDTTYRPGPGRLRRPSG